MSMPYVGARSWLFRREAGAADGLRCRDLLTGAPPRPPPPAPPPGAPAPLRPRQPLLGLERRLRIDEVPEPSVLRVGHHGLDVAARAQDELRITGDHLGGPVTGAPRRDVVGHPRRHVGVAGDA